MIIIHSTKLECRENQAMTQKMPLNKSRLHKYNKTMVIKARISSSSQKASLRRMLMRTLMGTLIKTRMDIANLTPLYLE